jgi:hypothetical protein
LYHLLFHFLGWFVLPQPDNVVICWEIKSQLIKGQERLSTWCWTERTIISCLFEIWILAINWASFWMWKTQRRWFTIKPIE